MGSSGTPNKENKANRIVINKQNFAYLTFMWNIFRDEEMHICVDDRVGEKAIIFSKNADNGLRLVHNNIHYDLIEIGDVNEFASVIRLDLDRVATREKKLKRVLQ